MMSSCILNKSSVHEGSLILVNQSCPLQGAQGRQLVPVSTGHPELLLRREAAAALQAALRALSAQGQIVPVSGYRSRAEQARLYVDSLRENGEAFTRQFVALPDCSEHQTGLAIDLGLQAESIDFLCPDFPYDGICQRFRQAAPHFGFIQRYPAGKESVTGIAHEPWHFRYVGLPHALLMAQQELTLEEYHAMLRRCTPERPLLFRGAQLYYLPAAQQQTTVSWPKELRCQVSGNNTDGFLVTLQGDER